MAIPFGLTNVSAAFMDLMNIVFRKYLDEFVIVFVEGMLMYSDKKELHENHLEIDTRSVEKE